MNIFRRITRKQMEKEVIEYLAALGYLSTFKKPHTLADGKMYTNETCNCNMIYYAIKFRDFNQSGINIKIKYTCENKYCSFVDLRLMQVLKDYKTGNLSISVNSLASEILPIRAKYQSEVKV